MKFLFAFFLFSYFSVLADSKGTWTYSGLDGRHEDSLSFESHGFKVHPTETGAYFFNADILIVPKFQWKEVSLYA